MKLAVFYHCRLSGGSHPANRVAAPTQPILPVHAQGVMREQFSALRSSGLLDQADYCLVGCNGDETECETLRLIAGPKPEILVYGADSCSELPTFRLMREWSEAHPDWGIFYHHSKGVCWPNEIDGGFRRDWRRCMTGALVLRWSKCVSDLAGRKLDMVGCHWISRELYPWNRDITFPIWGGNFFWSTASFLNELPPVHPGRDWINRWEAENWVGSGRRPRLVDYCPHWPNPVECGQNAAKFNWSVVT